MNPAQRESLHRAVELSITHQHHSSLYSQRYMSGNSESSPLASVPSNHSSHKVRRRHRPWGDRDAEMTTAASGNAESMYPSQRSAVLQASYQNSSGPHESLKRTNSSHRTGSPPLLRTQDSCHQHNASNGSASSHHGSSTDRPRRRSRDGERGEEEGSDEPDGRIHRHHGFTDRVSRRTRTDNNSNINRSVHSTATAATASSFSAATVQSLLPATSVAMCVLPLDAKLIELLYALSPTSDDRDSKLRVIDEVRQSLRRTGLDIQIYGSLCTGLAIPASDVDCVMMRSSDPTVAATMSVGFSNALLNIASAATNSLPQRAARAALSTGIRTAADRMRRHPGFTGVTCIAHARVPIVKCRHRGENVKVDLSFEKDGCVSSNYLCELFCEAGNELARPLIVLIKALVNHCGLDDPSIGGLGSFPISLLVLWYLKHCVPSRYAPELRHSIAVLLVGFLQYYGTEFDFKRQGIDYVQQKTFAKAPANELFIVNPIRPGTNCARAATLFATRVVPHFQKAAEALAPLLDVKTPATAMEQQVLQYFMKALPGVREWRDVARAAAHCSHLPQNMWDQATNLYMGGVL